MLPNGSVEVLETFFEYLIDRIALDYGTRTRNPWLQSQKRMGRLIQQFGRLPHEVHLLDEARNVYLLWSRVTLERNIYHDPISRSRDREARLLWAAAFIARGIGARSRFHSVHAALQRKGVRLSCPAIKMRVGRFEREYRSSGWPSQGPRWILEDLFDDFKGARWKKTHKKSLYRLHETEDHRLTGMTDKERALIRSMCA